MLTEHKVQLRLMGMSIAPLLIWTNLDNNNNIRIALIVHLTERHRHHRIRLIVVGAFRSKQQMPISSWCRWIFRGSPNSSSFSGCVWMNLMAVHPLLIQIFQSGPKKPTDPTERPTFPSLMDNFRNPCSYIFSFACLV